MKTQEESESTQRWTELLDRDTHARLLKLIACLAGKTWFDAWELHDVCYLIRAAHHHSLCKTCKGSGYQGLIGYPGCQGGCHDCAGTGLALPPL